MNATATYSRPWLAPYQLAALFGPERYAVTEATTKAGKSQPLDAIIYTPTGPRAMGDIAIGDAVLVPGGGVAAVVGVYPQGDRPIYRVSFSDGSATETDIEHLWEVCRYKQRPKVVPLSDLARCSMGTLRRTWVRQSGVAAFTSRPVPFDAYALGLLLGDGGLTTEVVRFSSEDQEILEALSAALPPGHWLAPTGGCDFRITAGKRAAELRESGRHLRHVLRDLGVLGKSSSEKFIPDVYRYNDPNTRWSILQGILDTDGFVDKHGQPGLEQTSGQLAIDVAEVVRSLGGTVRTTLRASNGYRTTAGIYIECKPVWRQSIVFADARACFRLRRKADRVRVKRKTGHRFIRSIEPVGVKPSQCIEVSTRDGLYLTDAFLPTHNTVGCLVWLTEQAMQGTAGWNYWWVAPIFAQAKIAFRRLKRALPRSVYVANESELTIALVNGTVIWFKGADKPDSLYGEDVHGAVIDEASRCKDEAWHAVRTTLTATEGPVRIIGNVKGRRNWAYQLARRAEAGSPDMHYAKITAADAVQAGIISQAEVDDARDKLPDNVFRELYMAEPSDDSGNPFGIAAIRARVRPVSQAPIASFGLDLAKSGDWCVLIGLDASGHVVDFDRWQGPWETTIQRVLGRVGSRPVLVDSTGAGDPVLEALQRQGRTQHAQFRGYTFSSASKQKLMEGLAVAIQQGQVGYPDGLIVQELEAFEFEYHRVGVTYSAPEGLHDDCVCALALAVHQMTVLNFGPSVAAILPNKG